MTTEPIKCLIVDDTEENLVALEALLRRDGLEILKARSGSQALELLLAHEIALAFLDVQMPEMDGFELAELMRGAERTKHVPIIFVTAGARDPSRMFKGYESGAVDFLFKPIDPHVLKSKADVFFELARRNKELAAALRLNEMFVGMLGHDLRNPLGAIMTGLEVLRAQEPDELQQRVLRRMSSSGQRMTDMIEQILDLTRARLAGGLGFARVREPLDICGLIQRVADELRGSHAERELRVAVRGDCSTLGDPGRLLQLFSNLIANALHHGATGGVVTAEVTGEDREIVARVHNAGAIPPDLLPTIFDPFRGKQGPRSHGLGLGLFISRQIAAAHGGSLDVESSPAAGTTFTARIPRRTSTRKPAAPARDAKTVLIVDDDETIRASLRDAFEDEGYRVATAADGKEALDRLADPVRPDVVILDLVLPILDGNRVFQAMQADPALAAIPVIVSTANPRGAPAGVTVVTKPLALHRLLDTVSQLTGPRA